MAEAWGHFYTRFGFLCVYVCGFVVVAVFPCWACPTLTPASLQMFPSVSVAARSTWLDEDVYAPHQSRSRCSLSVRVRTHPGVLPLICHAQIPLKSSPAQCFWSTDSLQAKHRLFRWGNNIVMLFPLCCKCHFSTCVIRLWIGHFFSLNPCLYHTPSFFGPNYRE